MKLTITVNIPKEKVKLLEMYDYNFVGNCEARIMQDWQDTFDTEEQTQRRKRIWDKAYSFKSDLTGTTLTNLKIEKADN